MNINRTRKQFNNKEKMLNMIINENQFLNNIFTATINFIPCKPEALFSLI